MAAFDRDVILFRPNPWPRLAALAPLLIVPWLALPATTGSFPFDTLGWQKLAVQMAAGTLALLLWVHQENPSPRRAHARLTVDDRAVSLDGIERVDLRAVRRAYLQPWWGATPTVKLVGRAGRTLLEVQVADEREGQALLDALGLGVSHKAVRFEGARPWWAFWGLQIVVLIATQVAGHFFNPLLGSCVWLLLLLTLFALSGAAIHVGADGILRTWLGTRRFYPYIDIAGFQMSGTGVRLWLNSGQAVDLPFPIGHGQNQRNAFLARAQAAHAAAVAGQRPAETVGLVARGGRSAADWLQSLHGLLRDSAEGYRSNAIPQESLWRVADDPAAEETARVGAAVALRASLDDGGRARLLQIAEASASPRVRVALRAAASGGDDEALVAALEACEAEQTG